MFPIKENQLISIYKIHASFRRIEPQKLELKNKNNNYLINVSLH